MVRIDLRKSGRAWGGWCRCVDLQWYSRDCVAISSHEGGASNARSHARGATYRRNWAKRAGRVASAQSRASKQNRASKHTANLVCKKNFWIFYVSFEAELASGCLIEGFLAGIKLSKDFDCSPRDDAAVLHKPEDSVDTDCHCTWIGCGRRASVLPP